MSEVRAVRYTSPENVADMDEWTVYKFFERSLYDPDCYQSTFAVEGKLEYRKGLITLVAQDDRGLSCIQVRTTTKRLMAKMEKNTDRLVMFRCTGYCHGEPPLEYSRGSGKISVLVRAIRLEEVVCTYNDLVIAAEVMEKKKKGGEQ